MLVELYAFLLAAMQYPVAWGKDGSADGPLRGNIYPNKLCSEGLLGKIYV